MRNFIKQTFASLVGSLLGLLIFSGLGIGTLLLILFAAAASKDVSPQVKDKSVLVFDLSTNITDEKPSSGSVLQRAISGDNSDRISLHDVLDAIAKAKRDNRIVAIYLDDSHGSAGVNTAGFATLKEIRQALIDFRTSGKKIIAYGMDWGEREYYLASVADTIMVNPLGAVEVHGLSSQPMFMAGAFQKYGIGVQVVRVGKFKGAVEPYILTKLSPANREQTQKLLDDIWGEWQDAVGKSRKITPEKLQSIADNQVVLEADQAKGSGLIDKVGYIDQVVSDLKDLTDADKGDKTFPQVKLNEYAQIAENSRKINHNSANKIAVVYAEGEIVDGEGQGGQIGGDRYARIFRKLRHDKNVKAVVLRINSPGGSATAAEVMQREIQRTREVKPVVVSMGDVAASGGYWIATNSNRIFAEPNTITGSIGVFGLLFNFQKVANDNGITWDTVKTARYADTDTISRPKSDAELAIYQHSVDQIYGIFVNKVAKGRNLPEAKVQEIAQGRVWSGEAAKDIGLVDEIGGLDAAIAYTAKQANLGDDWQLQEYPQLASFEERLFGQLAQETRTALGFDKVQIKPADPLTIELHKLQDEMGILQNMNDPQGLYARIPFNLKIEQ